jgi:hypothetical protein
MFRRRISQSILVIVLFGLLLALAVTVYYGNPDNADAADNAAIAANANLARCKMAGMSVFPEGAKSKTVLNPDPEQAAYQRYVVACMEGRGYEYGGKWCSGYAPLNDINCYQQPPRPQSELREWIAHVFHPAGPPACDSPKTGLDRDLCDFAVELAIGHWITNEHELQKSRDQNWDYVPVRMARQWMRLPKAGRCDAASAETFFMRGGLLRSEDCRRLTGDYQTPWQPMQPSTIGPGMTFAEFQARGCGFANMLDVSKELDLPTWSDKQAYYISLWISRKGRPWDNKYNEDQLLPDRDLMLTTCRPAKLSDQLALPPRKSWNEP